MAVIIGWSRLELRRRWRALLVLALLVALSTGTVLAAVAGARRADSAVDRLQARTLPATLAVLPNQTGFDWAAVRALPGVAALSEFAVTGYAVDDIAVDAPVNIGFPTDREYMETVERPVVLEGRLPDPDRVDEVVVSPGWVSSFGKGVGDVVALKLFTPEQIDGSHGSPTLAGAPVGPVVRATVVGVVRSPWIADTPALLGAIVPSPALLEQYPAQLLGHTDQVPLNALVRLDDESPAGVEAFRAGLARVSGRTDIDMLNLSEMAVKLRDTIRFEGVSLLAFGLAALAAALVLVGQAVARYVAAAVADLQVLRAVGMARRAVLAAAVVPVGLAGATGVAAGVGLAAASSPLFPIGTAADLEPTPGWSLDPLVLGLGG